MPGASTFPHPSPPRTEPATADDHVTADPAGVWPFWSPERQAGSMLRPGHPHAMWVNDALLLGPHPAGGPVTGPPVGYVDGVRTYLGADDDSRGQTSVLLQSHPYLAYGYVTIGLSPIGVTLESGFEVGPEPTLVHQPVAALPWGRTEITLEMGFSWLPDELRPTFGEHATTVGLSVGVHGPNWTVWIAWPTVSPRAAKKRAQSIFRAFPDAVIDGHLRWFGPNDQRMTSQPAADTVPFSQVAHNLAPPHVFALMDDTAHRLPAPEEPEAHPVEVAGPVEVADPVPERIYGGWRCWVSMRQRLLYLTDRGVVLTDLQDREVGDLTWDKVEVVQIGDASRTTLTRVAAVGIAGLGIKKQQVRLVLVTASDTAAITLAMASEAEVAGILQALAGRNAALAAALGTLSPDGTASQAPTQTSQYAAVQPDAATRLAQLRQVLEEGLIDQDEYDAKRAEIIAQI